MILPLLRVLIPLGEDFPQKLAFVLGPNQYSIKLKRASF